MKKETIDLNELSTFVKKLFHSYYSGDPQPWLSLFCADSIYLGTGEPLLFGADAIQDHFKDFKDQSVTIVQEEYFPFSLSDTTAQVCGQITVTVNSQYQAITYFTMVYRLTAGRLELVHHHNSYFYLRPEGPFLNLDINTTQFVRNLLLEFPSARRIAVRSSTQTIFVNPLTILYVQSQGKRTELVCVDKIISCNSPLGKLKEELPEVFYPIHRGYLVNTLYIVAIRRFEVELISGISLPIPALNYTRVKEDLVGRIQE